MELQIEKIAELARVNLAPGEKEKLTKDLEVILDYIGQLKTLDTEKVEPTSHVLDIENVFRPDEVKPCDVREEVLRHAPLREGDFFKVPKTVERE